MRSINIAIIFFVLIVGLLLSLYLGSLIGAIDIAPQLPFYFLQDTISAKEQHLLHIFTHIRLPRVLATALVGGNLAVCGVVMQGLFRNPLVDPGIVGVMSGASLAATLSIVLGTTLFPTYYLIMSDYALPVAAFLGGWAMTLALYYLAKRGGIIHISAMLLIGIAMSAFTGAITGLLIYLADDNQLRSLTFWSMGSLALFDWVKLTILAVLSILFVPLLWRDARILNALMLGEQVAEHLGFNIERAKKRQIFLVAALVGSCVAFSGGIGFIGLVVPHIVRRFLGANHRFVIPASFLFGAILLTVSDMVARIIVAPAELPIGIITAFFGAPFLGFLVWRRMA